MKYFVEWLARAEKFASELGSEQILPGARRAVHDEHGIAHDALGVALWLAEHVVMESQLRQRFARAKLEIAQNNIALARRRILGGVAYRPTGEQTRSEKECFHRE